MPDSLKDRLKRGARRKATAMPTKPAVNPQDAAKFDRVSATPPAPVRPTPNVGVLQRLRGTRPPKLGTSLAVRG